MKSLRVWLTSIALGAAMMFSASAAKAQVPTGFTYQGLVEENGVPVNGDVTFTITISDKNGNMFPSETFQNSPEENGVFNIVLNDLKSSPFQMTPSFNEPLIMTVGVATTNGENTLQALLWSSPYTINSGTVNGFSVSPVPVAGDLFPVPIGTGYTGSAKIDPAFLPRGIPNSLLTTPGITTINAIGPNTNGIFQIHGGNGVTITFGTNGITVGGSDVIGIDSSSAVSFTVQDSEKNGNDALLVDGGIGANNGTGNPDGNGLSVGSPETFFADRVSVPAATGTALQIFNTLVDASSSIVLTPVSSKADGNELSIIAQSAGTFTVTSTNTMGSSGGGFLTALNYMIVNH